MARNDERNDKGRGEQDRGAGGSWSDADDYYGNRGGSGEANPRRGEQGTSGSDGGRGHGAPWGGNRERGNSDYDHGAFDEGNASDRSYGQGMYNQRPGQQGQQGGRDAGHDGGYDAGRSQNWGESARGSDGGRERGNSYGNTGSERYGGGGFRGGYGSREQQGQQGQQRQQGGRGAAENDYGTNSGFGGGYGGAYSGGHAGGSISGRDSGATRSHAGRGPKGWKRSDERIRDDVSEQLERHHEIDASDIEVQVQNGEITLSGTVEDRRSKRMAEDIAESVPGVLEVLNQIRVKREASRGAMHDPAGSRSQIQDANPAQGFGNLHSQTTAQAGDQQGHTADQREGRPRKS